MDNSVHLRPARPSDSAELVLFADSASRRFTGWFWGEIADAGQSGLEVGRNVIETDTASVNHVSNWAVAELDGRIIGGLNSFVMPATTEHPDPDIALVAKPLNELKNLAEGSWYISVVAVHPEGRGHAIGTALLELGEQKARDAGCPLLTLMAGSFNVDAIRLYEKQGYVEWDRRPFVPFYGSDPEGEWVLLVKELEL